MTRHLGLDLGGTAIKTAVLEVAGEQTSIVGTGSAPPTPTAARWSSSSV